MIVVDVEKCLACRSCELACAVAHSSCKVLEEAINERPKPQGRVTVESSEGFAVPIQCRHCEDAPCIAVCPTEAIHRHSSADPVLIDRQRCIGCKFCLMACPFGVIYMMRDGKAVVKCDLCIERTKLDEEPACVEACPTGALKFVEEKELAAGKRKRAVRELVAVTREQSRKGRRTEEPK